jgi:uncharacterized protein (DUF58 family)
MKLTTTLVSAGFILIVATLLNIGQLYLMAGMLGAIPLVCWWVGRNQRGGLRASRSHVGSAAEGEPVTVTLALENRDRWPKPHLVVADRLPPGLVRQEGSASPVSLDASGTAEVVYTLRAEKRGCYTLGPLEVTAADPLGIFQFRSDVAVDSTLVIYPAPAPVPPLFLPGGNPYGASPLHSAEMRGEGSEFYGIREYQPGDPLRRVHWRSSARMGRLAVVEYEHDVSVDVTLLLDTQRGSEVRYEPKGERRGGSAKETTLEYAVTLAASIAHLAASQNDIVRLVAPGYAEWRDPGLRGPEALRGILDALARVEADQAASAAETLAGHAALFRRDSFVVVLTAVQSDALPAAIVAVTERGIKVAVLYVDPASFAGEGPVETPGAGPSGARHPAVQFRDRLAAAGARALVIRRGIPLGEQLV